MFILDSSDNVDVFYSDIINFLQYTIDSGYKVPLLLYINNENTTLNSKLYDEFKTQIAEKYNIQFKLFEFDFDGFFSLLRNRKKQDPFYFKKN